MVIDADNTARQHLLAALREVDYRLHVKPCDDAKTAQALISEGEFDVWFLDIDLPGISGFSFLDDQQCRQEIIPPIVFTTTHHDFALRAFDYPVLDYLLKPLSSKRVAKTLQKLNSLRLAGQKPLNSNPAGNALTHKANDASGLDANTLIRFKNGSSFLCLRHADIVWIEAAGDYMCLHTLTDTHILRSTMVQLEKQLCGQQFVRVNRSALVNWRNVKGYKSAKNGNCQVEMINQNQLSVSRKYKIQLPQLT